MEKIIILGFLLTISQSSIADVNECPVTANCDCSHFVDCREKGLTELPPMVKTARKFGYVSFRSNSIARVEDGYFSSLSIFLNYLTIDLSYNNINYISPKAFQGLENVRLRLHLEHNDIVALPAALLPLNHLEHLRISGIQTYAPEIVEHVSKTVTMLAVGDLTEWPEGLKLFSTTVQLYLFELRMSKLSADDLKNLGPSLVSISIRNSFFQEPLDGLCGLYKLKDILLRNLTSPSGVELTPRCQPPMSSVEYILAENIYLRNIARIQDSMPNLMTLSLTLPDLKNLTLPARNRIQSLSINSTQLEKIPTSKGMSESLHYLNILNSKISSIKAEDLRNFPNLGQIGFVNNPLTSISEDAFENKEHIYSLEIAGSNLTAIPKAITRLPNLSYLILKDNPILCSCDMAWLLGWSRFQKVRILGDCMGNQSSLSSYTKNDLNKCNKNSVVG